MFSVLSKILKMKTILSLLIAILIISCNRTTEKSTVNKSEDLQSVITDTNVYSILQNNASKDSIEVSNWDPFYYLKTGYFLNSKEKNALLIRKGDSLYNIELYSYTNDNWVKNSELHNIELKPTQLYITFQDYNFDNKPDIYLQCTASNGYPISRGQLITIEHETGKMNIHPEARNLGNMKPDPTKKVIISEEWNECIATKAPCLITNKWKNGKLIYIDKTCPKCN